MKIVEVHELKDCLTEPHLREVMLDGVISRNVITALGTLGKLSIMDTFSPAFFKVEHDRFTLKGIEGKNTIRIDAYGQELDEIIILIHEKLAGFN